MKLVVGKINVLNNTNISTLETDKLVNLKLIASIKTKQSNNQQIKYTHWLISKKKHFFSFLFVEI